MRTCIVRFRGLIVTIVLLVALVAIVRTTSAQPPVPHGVIEGDDCLSCHEAGVADALRLARDHAGRLNEDCAFCHEHSGAHADDIPHTVAGRDDCLSCHSTGIGTILARSHLQRKNDQCRLCHLPSAAALQPTPVPNPTPVPAPLPASTGAETCVACHQLNSANEQHTLFTGQPAGDKEVGAALFAQWCVDCHGEDGATPVGDKGSVINAEAYWSVHEDAAILADIGASRHGEVAAFADAYGGPLSWEEILNLAAFVRSWGPVGPPDTEPAVVGPTFVDTIAPLLTERCGVCHGGSVELTLTDYASLMSGPVIVPGDPEGSRIVRVQQSEHYAQLSEAEMSVLFEWIANGAPER